MLQRFDELNNLETQIRMMKAEIASGRTPSMSPERCVDEIFDILLIAWAMGNNDAAEQLGEEEIEVPVERIINDIYHRIDGITFVERARKHLADGNAEALITLVETEVTHDYNSGVLTTGLQTGRPLMKRWNTQLDDRVRDTHSYLESVAVPIDAEFYTYTGSHGLAPTMFGDAEEDCGCRCYLTLEPIVSALDF